MKQEHKDWIDEANYELLLRRNRFGPLGDEIFLDDTGEYFLKSMAAKKQKLGINEAVAISKRIGWTL